MKKYVILFILFSQFCFSQNDYFNAAFTVCNIPDDKEIKDKYKLGLDCIKANKYIGGANRIFLDILKKDSTFCDAYYLAGYTYRLSNMNEEAFTYYYIADSLSNNKSLMFKQDLAFMASKLKYYKLARKKYEEIKQFFPKSIEGYYGIASTSLILGDSAHGLENLNLALLVYNQQGLELVQELHMIHGILLTLNEKYDESIVAFEKLSWPLITNDAVRTHYALSLIKEGKHNNNEKQIKKAKKIFEKIKDKTVLSEIVTSEFQ